MSYKKANDILPRTLLRAVQQYIDGEYLYIPRKAENRQAWGTNTRTRETVRVRNREILSSRFAGASVAELARRFFLSEKAIYKIIQAGKKG